MKFKGVCAVGLASLLVFTGCETIKGFAVSKQVEQIPVAVQKQEIVEVAPGEYLTNSVLATNWVTVTNTLPSKTLTTGIEMVTGSLTPGGGALVGKAASGLLVGIFAFFNHRRQKKVIAAAQGEKVTLENQIETVVQGVDVIRDHYKETLAEFNKNEETTIDPKSLDAKAMKGMEAVIKAAGHTDDVRKVIKKVRKYI